MYKTLLTIWVHPVYGGKRPSALNELTNLAQDKIRPLFYITKEVRKNFCMSQLKRRFW